MLLSNSTNINAESASAILSGIAILLSVIQFLIDKNNRISQKRKVVGWIEYDDPKSERTICTLINMSKEPIYEVVVTPVIIDPLENGIDVRKRDEFNGNVFALIPPGAYTIDIPLVSRGMFKEFTIEIAYRDSKQSVWVRKGNGVIEHIGKKIRPLDYYHISRPIGSGSLQKQ